MDDIVEYRLEYRHSSWRRGEWHAETQTWQGDDGRQKEILAWAKRVADNATTGWEHRIVSRRVSAWEPIEHMDEALAAIRAADEAHGLPG